MKKEREGGISVEKYAAIGKENLKFNLPAHFLLCAALLLLSPLFIGLENLNQQESAKVLEYYPVFLGVILITGTGPEYP